MVGGNRLAVPSSRRSCYWKGFVGTLTPFAGFLLGLQGTRVPFTAGWTGGLLMRSMMGFTICFGLLLRSLSWRLRPRRNSRSTGRTGGCMHAILRPGNQQVHIASRSRQRVNIHTYPRSLKRRAHPKPANTTGMIRGNRVPGSQAPMRRLAALHASLAPGTQPPAPFLRDQIGAWRRAAG